MTRKILIISIVVVGLITLASVFYRIGTSSTLIIALSPSTSPSNTSVKVDGTTIFPSGQDGQEYRAKVGRGSHEISVTSAGFSDMQTDVSTGFRNTLKVNMALTKITAEEVAESTVAAVEGIKVFEPRFFGENDWMIFFTRSAEGVSEGSMIIAKFDDKKPGWVIVEEGTDFDVDAAIFSDAPSELISYLKGSRE